VVTKSFKKVTKQLTLGLIHVKISARKDIITFGKGVHSVNRSIKKIIYLIVIICIILSMSQSAFAAGTFRATGDVNIRSEPSTDASVLMVIYTGSNVEVLEHNPAGWSKVQAGGTTGYIRSDYLKFPVGSTPATFYTTDGVNLREAESTDSKKLSSVRTGTSVEMLEHNPAGWSKVRISGTTGYIRSDFLTCSSGVTSSTQTASPPSSPSPAQAIGTLKTIGSVNMRSSSSTTASIVKTLSANTSVEVLANEANGWTQARHNEATGYIRSDLLSESGSSSAQTVSTLKTIGSVNLRASSSTSASVVRTLAANTSVEVLEKESNGWSCVRHNGTTGYIRSDLLSESGSSSAQAIATLRTIGGVNFRTGPSTNADKIRTLPAGTSVDVLENESNGWSRVRYKDTVGYIRSDLLGPGRSIELLDWSSAKSIVPTGVNLRVVDVRTGISFNLRSFSKGGHADVEPPTKADTDAMLRTRNGTWAWAPRPVWVTIGERTFAAALNGMPHDVSTIRDNGINGHLCLHFNNTVTNSKSYQRDLNNAVVEAWDKRPR